MRPSARSQDNIEVRQKETEYEEDWIQLAQARVEVATSSGAAPAKLTAELP
jgi:hypothetical protein